MTNDELRRIYLRALGAYDDPLVERYAIDAGLRAVFLAGARAQREMEPTEAMIEAGAIAASQDGDFRADPVIPYEECDNVFRAEWRGEALAAYRAMQRVAPLVGREG